MLGVVGWFKALSVAAKTGVVTSAVVVGGTGIAAVSPESEPAPEPTLAECVSSTSQEADTEITNFDTNRIKDSNLQKGKKEIRTLGVNGERKLTYEVTKYTPENCQDSTRTLVKEEVVKKPTSKVVAIGTYVPPPSPPPPSPNCDSNYSGCVPIASDVDCGGGSGNGPEYVYGTVRVIGSDIYDLDRDGDGYGCD